MSNIKFAYDNKLDDVSSGSLSASTSAPYWPVENIQKRWTSRGWRSSYGLGSGAGRYEITTSNNKLYFDEGAGQLTATITVGTYNADSLCEEIVTQMESAGTQTYSCTFDKTTFKFTIYCDGTGDTVELDCDTTTNAIWDTIGFNTSAATGFASSHTADYIRIHTSEEVTINRGLSTDFDFIAIFGHNIQTTGMLNVQLSNDNFVTTPYDITMTRGTNLLLYLPAETLSYQYVRFYITDIDNPDGYVTIGRAWGGAFDYEPTKGYNPNRNLTPIDPSTFTRSEGGQINSILRPHYKSWNYNFDFLVEYLNFKAIFDSRGKTRELVILEKEASATTLEFTNPEDNLWYSRIASFGLTHKAGRWSGKIRLELEL